MKVKNLKRRLKEELIKIVPEEMLRDTGNGYYFDIRNIRIVISLKRLTKDRMNVVFKALDTEDYPEDKYPLVNIKVVKDKHWRTLMDEVKEYIIQLVEASL